MLTEREKAYKRQWYANHQEKCQQERREYYWHKKKPCPICGKPIAAISKTCCKCHSSGEDNPAWRGGRTVRLGYVFIHSPTHPRASTTGYVREHLLAWEQFHNKPLPKGWIIHHLNGIRNDNCIANLIALPDNKHRHILAAKAKRIQELEALLNHQSQIV